MCPDICRCLYATALPFNSVKDLYFKIMLESIVSFGKALKPPPYHEESQFKKKIEMELINRVLLESCKIEWKKTSCTLMYDGWTDRKNGSITNFFCKWFKDYFSKKY